MENASNARDEMPLLHFVGSSYHAKSQVRVKGLAVWRRHPLRQQPRSLNCPNPSCGFRKVWYLGGLGWARSECQHCGTFTQMDDPESRCPFLLYKGAPDGRDFLYRYGIVEITVEVYEGKLCWVLWKEAEIQD